MKNFHHIPISMFAKAIGHVVKLRSLSPQWLHPLTHALARREPARKLRAFLRSGRALGDLLPIVLASAFALAAPAQGANLPLTFVRSVGDLPGGGVDTATGQYFDKLTYNGSSVLIYADRAAYEAGAVASTVNFQSWGGGATYFGLLGGKFYGKGNAGSSSMTRWLTTTGAVDGSIASVPGMQGGGSLNWGAGTDMNVLNDRGQLYVLGTKTGGGGWALAQLNADLTLGPTQVLNVPSSQGYAFIVNGYLFFGGGFNNPAITTRIHIATNTATTVSHSFTGPGGYYITNAFYDPASDLLYLLNQSALYRAGNVASLLDAHATTTTAATAVSATGATLNGSVAPAGLATTASFTYGTSPTLSGGTSTAAQDVGTGTATVPVSEALTGLTPDTTYYFRISQTNTSGTANGSILSFVTGPEIAVEQPAGTHLIDGSATISFGDVQNGQPSAAKTFTIRNKGALDLTGLAITKDGTHKDDYAVSALGSTTLASGASTTFTVTLTPGASGTRAATLQIASNDGDENPFDLALTGNGVPYVQSPGYTIPATAGNNTWNGYTIGNRFTATANCVVTALGAFDAGLNGLAAATPVGLWNSGGTLLASTTVAAGTADPLTGQFRYHALASPIYLTAGQTYQMGALCNGNDLQYQGNSPAGTAFDSRISHQVGCYSGGGGTLTFPAYSYTQHLFGANLLLAPTTIPPWVASSGATSVTPTSATLNASVNPLGRATSVVFQYSTDATLSSGVTTTSTQNIGSGTAAVAVSQAISGLTLATTYYYRAVATNAYGTTHGEVVSFVAGVQPAPAFSMSNATSSSTYYSYTFGAVFTVSTAVTVSHLGVYDHNQDGLGVSMPVGLWNGSGALLASTTVAASTADPLTGVFRYRALTTPVNLPAGQYRVGALYNGSNEPQGLGNPGFTSDSRVTFNSACYQSGGALAYPINNGGPAAQVWGANLLLTAPADTTPPGTSITAGPGSVTNSPSASISFSGSDNVTAPGSLTFEGRLDGAAFATVTSPVTLSGLSEGSHTFEVRAKDAANNTDPTPASVTWVVDTVGPTFSLPGPITVEATSSAGAVVTYSASASDTGGSGVASASFTPASGSTFPMGTTTVNASATDNAGNTATGSFTVTVVSPEIAVEQPLGTGLADGAGTVSFAATQVGNSSDVIFTIRNTGSGALSGLGITIDGANANEFAVTASPTAPVAGSGGSTSFTVRFEPIGTGVRTAVLHLASNDVDENPFDIALAGTGFTGEALAFDGINDAVTIAAHTDFNPAAGTFTVEGWVRPVTGMPRWARLFGTAANHGDLVVKTDTAEHFSFAPRINGNTLLVIAPTSWVSGQWYHIAGVLDGSTARLFVDGVQVAARNYTGDWEPDTGVRYIGRSIAGNNFLFRGAIDEVRFWDYARNCDQIAQARSGELTGAEPGLVAYYKFTQGVPSGNNTAITSVVDSANDGNHPGTLAGFDLTNGNSTSNFVGPGGVTTGWLAPTPEFTEINVTGNGVAILSGDTTPSLADHTDFGGSTTLGVTRTFTIENTGNKPLNVSAIVLSGANAGDFTLGGFASGTLVAPPSSPNSVSFTVSATPSAVVRNATITITNDDCDEGSYTFAIRSFPTILVSKAEVTVNEGALATNTGRFAHPVDNASLTLTASRGTISQNNAAGTWTWSYTPANGPDDSTTVTITATHASEPPVTNAFMLDVNNLAPTALAQLVPTVLEDSGPHIITLGATDPGVNDTLTYSIVTPPPASKGTVALAGKTVTLTPSPNATGLTTFTFKAYDGVAYSNIAQVSISMTPVNDPPVFVAGPHQAHPAGTSTAQSFAGWATGINDGDPEVVQTLNFTIVNNSNPGLFATQPAIGSTGALTYRPAGTEGIATISVALKDNGGVANGGIDTSAVQTFTIRVASFRTGTYTGLATPTAGTTPSQNNLGRFTGTLGATGSFSGSVNFGGTLSGFVAPFNLVTGNATGSNDNLAWNLNLDPDFESEGNTDKITGTVTKKVGGVATDVCAVDADLATFTTANPVPAGLRNGAGNGVFTVVFQPKDQEPAADTATYPQGYGYGTITVTPAGAVTLAGTLADGTVITASAPMSKALQWPLAAHIKSTSTVVGVTLGGRVRFDTAEADSDLSAVNLQWFRPAFANASSYKAGWPAGLAVDAVGARYNAAMTVQDGLGLDIPAGNEGNADLIFTDGKLDPEVTIANFKIVNNTVTKIPTTDASFTLTLAPATGIFSGTFTPSWTGTAKPTFRGMFLQKGANKGGFGFFTSNVPADANPEIGSVFLGK